MASQKGREGSRLYVEVERCAPERDGDAPTGIIRAHGEIDLDTVEELRDCLDPNLWEGCAGVLVDLTDVRFMDSTGLSALVVADKSFGDEGIRLAITTESRSQIEGLLELTGMRLRIPDSL